VGEICRRLDGLPLALELAAPRLKIFSPPALCERLEHRLELLTGGARDLPSRQQTLRATIDWSYQLLEENEQRLFRRLGVFAGGFSLEGAASVWAPQQSLNRESLDALASLADKQLLRRQQDVDGEPRFDMLETIREYALERLDESDEALEARRRHAVHYVALAEAAASKRLGTIEPEWLGRLSTEHDNFRAALSWLASQSEQNELELRLAVALSGFWWGLCHLREGRVFLEGAIARGLDQPLELRLEALFGLGGLANRQGDVELAQRVWDEGLALAQRAGDTLATCRFLRSVGSLAQEEGEFERARLLHEESVRLAREAGEEEELAHSLINLTDLALEQGDHKRATELGEEGLAICLGAKDSWGAAITLANLGYAALQEGNEVAAAERLGESLSTSRKLGDSLGMAVCLVGFALLAISRQETMRAARLLGGTQGLLDSVGASFGSTERGLQEAAVETVRVQLGEEQWSAVSSKGRDMGLEQMVELALGT
jgi:tetratricopeptide (TPR) repeat protein